MSEEQEPSIFPLTIGDVTLTRYDGASYVDESGRTYYSGAAEPSEADAQSAVATPVNPPEVRPVPFFVKAWRLRSVSKEQGLYDAAMAAMEALPEPYRTRAIEAFNDADIERKNPLVAMVYQGIGLTSEQVDQLFRDADSIA